jgi:hypothetical protein
MSAHITRGGEDVRPSFNFSKSSGYSHESITAQLAESTRNVLEDIQRSQMLQCDVAHAIKDIAKTLRRIDRRLAQMQEAKLKGGRA